MSKNSLCLQENVFALGVCVGLGRILPTIDVRQQRSSPMHVRPYLGEKASSVDVTHK